MKVILVGAAWWRKCLVVRSVHKIWGFHNHRMENLIWNGDKQSEKSLQPDTVRIKIGKKNQMQRNEKKKKIAR